MLSGNNRRFHKGIFLDLYHQDGIQASIPEVQCLLLIKGLNLTYLVLARWLVYVNLEEYKYTSVGSGKAHLSPAFCFP